MDENFAIKVSEEEVVLGSGNEKIIIAASEMSKDFHSVIDWIHKHYHKIIKCSKRGCKKSGMLLI